MFGFPNYTACLSYSKYLSWCGLHSADSERQQAAISQAVKYVLHVCEDTLNASTLLAGPCNIYSTPMLPMQAARCKQNASEALHMLLAALLWCRQSVDAVCPPVRLLYLCCWQMAQWQSPNLYPHCPLQQILHQHVPVQLMTHQLPV